MRWGKVKSGHEPGWEIDFVSTSLHTCSLASLGSVCTFFSATEFPVSIGFCATEGRVDLVQKRNPGGLVLFCFLSASALFFVILQHLRHTRERKLILASLLCKTEFVKSGDGTGRSCQRTAQMNENYFGLTKMSNLKNFQERLKFL